MVSPFQGTPNIPLQVASATKECVPRLRASGGKMYSTRLSPPKPPVIPTCVCFAQNFAGKTGEDDVPCKGVPSVVYIIASQPGSNSTLKRLSTAIRYGDAIDKTYTGRGHSPSTQVVYSP
jgi:hypothetical protein